MSGPQSTPPVSQFPAAPAPPTQDERSMGMLVHLLSIFTGFWAPLIIYVIKRDSKFVSFHALQSLFWHLLYLVVAVFLMFVFFILIFSAVISHVAQQHGPGGPPPAFIFFFPFFWLVWIVLWAVNLILGIVFAIKANAGEWAAYPLVGQWARRAVGV